MKKIIQISTILIVLFMSCKEAEHKTEESLILPVTSPAVVDTKSTTEYVCQVHAKRHIELKGLESGYLQKIYVDEGQFVKKGQNMFQIMPNVLEAELQKAKAEADLANIEYLNTKALADSNVVSSNELAIAKAHLDMAKAEVSLVSTHLGFTHVKAPFTGVMDHLLVREGSLIEEGELLTTLSDNSKMWVYFNVPEAVYLDYMSQSEAERPKEVYLKMANGEIFKNHGQIDAIEGEFNNETGTIQFRATFDNPDKILRHGQTGTIMIDIPFNNALVIPQKTTFEVLDKKYVFVLNEENILEQKEIKIAKELPNIFIVSSGLSKTDKILLDGLRRVRNGDEIDPKFEKPEEVLEGLVLYAE